MSNRIAPGGHTGWHTHPGPSLITVKSGRIWAYDGDDPTCTPTVYEAGQGFVDPGGGDVHILRNEGSVEAETIATQLLGRGRAADRHTRPGQLLVLMRDGEGGLLRPPSRGVAVIESYLIEEYVPRAQVDEARAAADRIRKAAAALSRDGTPARHVRTTVVPDDETCFHVVEASSLQAVEEVSRRAALGHARIVPAIEASTPPQAR